MVASWLRSLWQLQSDTLGLSATVADFSLAFFLPEQVEFHLKLCIMSFMFINLKKLVESLAH